MKPKMTKKISAAALLTLLLLCSVDTPVLTGAEEPLPAHSVWFEAPPDTVCLRCYVDSIAFILRTVKKNMAKIDSLSDRVQQNAQKIVENNRAIDIILHACAPDTVYVVREVSRAVKDTAIINPPHSIEAQKKKAFFNH